MAEIDVRIIDEKTFIAMTSALTLSRELADTSPYLCLCGVLGKRAGDCEWHVALGKLADALTKIGFAPSWWWKEKQRENEEAAENSRIRKTSDVPGDDEGRGGQPPPNCS